MEWKRAGTYNEVYGEEKKNYFISYNPNPSSMDGLSIWDGDGGPETALVSKLEGYLILNGDFRKEYEEAYRKGYDACKEVFLKYKDEHVSSWSDVK